jgi:hypothetical protein
VLIGLEDSRVEQTSVRLLPATIAALDALLLQRRCSRDQVIRDLLDAYVTKQSDRKPGDRLTHVTAVLHYPPLPAGRRRPDGKVRVPLRLTPGAAESVEDLTLQLPGQIRRRGLKHYARSPLAEAICTALSGTYAWQVPGLEGLPAVWTQAAAVGLWRLAIAATLTKPEQRAVLGELDLLGADGEDPNTLAELLRHSDLAWHHPWRDEVALRLARNLLTGPDSSDRMRSLRDRDDEFEQLRYDLERTDDLDHPMLTGAPKLPSSNVIGRGGALVWRGRRRLALRNVAEWIVSAPAAPLVVSPPRVKITNPDGWTSIQVPAGEQLPETVAADVEARRVLLVTSADTVTAWPYSQETGEPVPWFDLVLEALPSHKAEEIVELVLLDDNWQRTIYLLADEAHALGFIDTDERDSLNRKAAVQTDARMAAIVERATAWDPEDRDDLLANKANRERFFEIARRHHQREYIVRPWWTWDAGSTVRELKRQVHTRDQVRKLIERRGHYWKRELELTMESAGRAAIAGYRVILDDDDLFYVDLFEDEANDEAREGEETGFGVNGPLA